MRCDWEWGQWLRHLNNEFLAEHPEDFLGKNLCLLFSIHQHEYCTTQTSSKLWWCKKQEACYPGRQDTCHSITRVGGHLWIWSGTENTRAKLCQFSIITPMQWELLSKTRINWHWRRLGISPLSNHLQLHRYRWAAGQACALVQSCTHRSSNTQIWSVLGRLQPVSVHTTKQSHQGLRHVWVTTVPTPPTARPSIWLLLQYHISNHTLVSSASNPKLTTMEKENYAAKPNFSNCGDLDLDLIFLTCNH